MIYFSYFGNRKLATIDDSRKLSIALWSPKWLPKIEKGPEFFPPDVLLEAYKLGIVNWEQYTETYNTEVLSKLDRKKLYEKYDNKILLCYCKSVCHRDLVREWFAEDGYEVMEI